MGTNLAQQWYEKRSQIRARDRFGTQKVLSGDTTWEAAPGKKPAEASTRRLVHLELLMFDYAQDCGELAVRSVAQIFSGQHEVSNLRI